MGYKVFISHSTRDQGLVVALAKLFTTYGLEVFVAEWYLTPGGRLNEKVFKQIDSADSVLVLLSKDGMRSNWVQQEIGYALRCEKPVIPLVETGVQQQDLGALQGRAYIKYDPSAPQAALLTASTFISSLKLTKDKQQQALVVLGLILLFLLLLSGAKK